ncbi:MAG: DNA mismatch repair endonuclease MutL [Candidatus Aminicenantales bacterium]
MKKIILLPPELSAKIAAGEVIERPFSVVKELVENSLDAGASEVRVHLERGGKKLIRVMDNGEGMSPEDAEICFERHATSKIAEEADLEKIETLGFRGEALPSISAVSRVTLKTSRGAGAGFLVEREGNQTVRMGDTAFPRGTSVEVRDLFFNLPARRKFLRSEKSELFQVVRFLNRLALAFPQTRFSLSHGSRRIFDYPGVAQLRERIFQVFGKEALERLMALDFAEETTRISGFVSRPLQGRRNRSRQFIFVNGRPVQDKTIQAALNQTFQGYLEKDRVPEAILFVSMPAAHVDVNVHPTKAEIRFRDAGAVFHAVRLGLLHALTRASHAKSVRSSLSVPAGSEASAPPAQRFPARGRLAAPKPQPEVREEWLPAFEGEGEGLRVFGQYQKTFILASDDRGLLVIDQHNAHERVLYEKYADIDRKKDWPRKMALFPAVIDLTPAQALSYESNQGLLEEVGYRVEDMGGRSFALKEYPDIFSQDEAQEVFLSLLDEMREDKAADKKKKILAELACRTAVKAGQVLSSSRMKYLVEELFRTSKASVCPHGRPILLRLEKDAIEKAIGRKSRSPRKTTKKL